MTNYQVIEDKLGSQCIKRIDDDGTEWFIPLDPANSDYQLYLRWLENPDAEEGGTL